jgi:glutamate dehydrogenase/leucine dehydrogenase
VPAGDIGVGGREVGFLFGMYKKLRNEFTGVLTGKGKDWGGSLIRPEATGYGAIYFASEMLAERGEDLKGRAVAVSGSGNVAQFAVEKLIDMGARPITMSDSSGTIVDKEGIDAEKLAWIKALKNERRGRIREYAEHFDGVQYLEGGKPWGVACDVAVPCATQNELDGDEARELLGNGCALVVEGANMPCTAEATAAFLEAGTLFAPGKAANAGGVATSGLEMSQNSMRLSWSREEVDRRLHDIMRDIHSACVEHGRQEDGSINYVDGANVAGFIKVADAMMDQGIV